MRIATALIAVAAAAAPASADHFEAYALDPDTIPVPCRALVTGSRMGARISVASCEAREEFARFELDDSAFTIERMNAAVRSSTLLLDTVIAAGTEIEKVEALRAKSDLYSGMVGRMRRTAPALQIHTAGREMTEAYRRHDAIEAAIAPWQQIARSADAMVVRIAHAHPEILRDPVARMCVRAAEASTRVAAR